MVSQRADWPPAVGRGVWRPSLRTLATRVLRHRNRRTGNLGVIADPDGFVPFYRQEAEAVLMFLTRRTLDGEVALDLTAETFAQAWRGWSRVREDSREEMRAWLFTIANRQFARYLRRGRAQRRAVRRLGIRTPSVHEDDLAAIEEAAGLGDVRLGLRVELGHVSSARRSVTGRRRDALRGGRAPPRRV